MSRSVDVAALARAVILNAWPDGDAPGRFWASLELPIGGLWISVTDGGRSWPSEVAARAAAQAELQRRLALLGEAFAGLERG